MKKKLTDKQKIFSNKTDSKIPKTPRQKKMWVRARQIVAKETGRTSESGQPWGLVTKIYKDENKAGKVAKKSDVKKAKVSKTVRKYKLPDRKKK